MKDLKQNAKAALAGTLGLGLSIGLVISLFAAFHKTPMTLEQCESVDAELYDMLVDGDFETDLEFEKYYSGTEVDQLIKKSKECEGIKK